MKKKIHRPLYWFLPVLLLLPVAAALGYVWFRWGTDIQNLISTGLKAGLIP